MVALRYLAGLHSFLSFCSAGIGVLAELIIRKRVRAFGSGGHVTIPKEFIGHEVAIVTDEDMLKLEDLIYEVLALRKLKVVDDSEAMKKARAVEAELKGRVSILEDRVKKLEEQQYNS